MPIAPALSQLAPSRFGPPPTIAVIGGGFSGLLTAIHLLSSPNRPRVRLIERSSAIGRGTAYATEDANHLLNVRVANMSAFPDQPDHLVAWLASHSRWSAHGGFMTRGSYGDYLRDLLRQTVQDTPGGQLVLERDEVLDIEPGAAGWKLTSRRGHNWSADAVVMATGVPRPAPPDGVAPEVLQSRRYISDPWTDDLGQAGRRVLMLGSGLTMIDVALSLSRDDRQLWAMSRRGLLPREHAVSEPDPVIPPVGISPLELHGRIRAASAAGDWRSVIDGYRPHLHRIWRDWPTPQRRRFLRHLRPWWDVHRHRMAPAVARNIEDLQSAGVLTVTAGRLESLSALSDGVAVAWRQRGGGLTYRIVDTVVNCTGGRTILAEDGDSLVGRLAAAGLVRPDACSLGIDVDRRCRVLGASGLATPGLYAVGPMTQGVFGEMTSVPDLRLQAAEVARTVTASFAARAAGA